MNNQFTPHKPIVVSIQFRHMPKSHTLKELVQQQSSHLRSFAPDGGSCDVVFDAAHHKAHGELYEVSVRLKLPGEKLLVASAQELSGSPEYMCTAVFSAFDKIKLQMKKLRKRNLRHRDSGLVAA